ncbi:MAG: hypothetical protein HY744_16335 [Deltaproteobacteria bacterium]|nr:hypothetical protein [Deltaproteobacteria bacterium]
MEPVRIAHHVLAVLLVAVAWLVWRRRRDHLALALYLTFMSAGDFVRLCYLPHLRSAPRPYAGWHLLLSHADVLLVLGWSFLFAACMVHYFLGRRPTAIYGAYGAIWLICLNYPLVSGDVYAWVLRAVSLGCLLLSWACIGYAVLRRAALRPGLAHLVLMLYAANDVVLNLIPWAKGFFGYWYLVRYSNVVLYAACCGAHLYVLAARRHAAPVEA